MSTAPPLTPPDCDLRDFRFMPLDVVRLRDSDLAAVESPEACWAAVQLWGASWHQVPAGSLPDDDRILAQLAGYGRVVKEWMKVRAGAIRGFVLCTDGRLYHPVVAEKAREAWQSKLTQRWRTECARIKKHNQRTGEDKPWPTVEEFLAAVYAGAGKTVPEDGGAASPATDGDVLGDRPGVSRFGPPGNGIQGTGIGTGNIRTIPDGMDGEPSSGLDDDDLSQERSLPVARGSWRLAIRVLVERGGSAEAKARTLVGRWVREGLTVEDLWRVAEDTWRLGTMDPVPYMTRGVQAAIERRASAGGGIDLPSERQQEAWMRDWAERGPAAWKRHERGPCPGEDGCRVSPDIQTRFSTGAAA